MEEINERYQKGFPKVALERLYVDLKKISIYDEEETAALYGDISMTEEIFKRCRNIAFACFDTETIYYLIKKFPEFPEKQ